MAIVVYTNNQKEENALLAFLNQLNYDYEHNEPITLSEAQQNEILKRDRLYEAVKLNILR
jgi:hypothetical protein